MASELDTVLATTVRTHARTIESWDGPVREDTHDAVHQMRVSARTLRSVVQIYGPLFEPEARSEISRTLRRLGRRLATARDAEVIHDLVHARIDELPKELTAALPKRTVKRLRKSIARDSATATEQLFEAMDSPEHRDDLTHITALTRMQSAPLATDLSAAQVEDAPATLAPFVIQRMDEVMGMAKGATATPEPKERNELLHELRKEAKRVRYAVTAVRDAAEVELGPETDALMRTAKKLQRALGNHHDSVLLQEYLVRTARQARGKDESTFGYGILYAREARVQERALTKARRLLGQ